MNYEQAGVNVELANNLLASIKQDIAFTKFFCNKSNNGSIVDLNDYCSCISLDSLHYENPILTFSTDGVGSKLILADKHPTVNSDVTQDLFAMVFNDIICSGSRPLYFLDYYATHSLHEKTLDNSGEIRFSRILKDLTRLCSEYSVGIIGGETAEIPMIYSSGRYDLAGFGVGIVEKRDLITKSRVRSGDVIIGIESSGPHSNGYTLINSIENELSHESIKTCLTPTRIYVKPILELMNNIDIHGIAHITGGGVTENLPRVIRDDLNGVVDLNSWKKPKVFEEIAEIAEIDPAEMLKTFNCGIGMIVIVSEEDHHVALEILNSYYKAIRIGFVSYRKRENKIEYWGTF